MAATSRRAVKRATVALAVVGAAVAWYLFRPELLFITRTVDEALPQAPRAATIDRLADGTRVLRLTESAVSIWCARFSVNFGAAALAPIAKELAR